MAFIMLASTRGIAVIDKPRAGRTETRRRNNRRARASAAVLAAFLVSGGIAAQPEYDGHFEVQRTATEIRDNVLYLDALIELMLSSEATRALTSDVTLTISIEVEILHRLRLWWDLAEIPLVVSRHRLSYDRLASRYFVYNESTDDGASFATLSGALAFIGRVDDLPVADVSLLNRNRRYGMRVRAVLERDELSGPFAIMTFWRNGWSIDSDWREWRLDLE
jgi:hypothetical protein